MDIYDMANTDQSWDSIGAGGTETAAWGQAAGLRGFDTWHSRCVFQLTSNRIKFQWPEGVTEVDLGFREKIKKPGT